MFLLALALVAGGRAAPKVGEAAPEFSLPTVSGETVRLAELTAKSKVVLVVLRGYPGYQCPLCTRQVNEFIGRAEEFSRRGARVLFVYPGEAAELERRAKEFAANKGWPAEFTLLLDPGYTFTQAYGLRWDEPKETAYPATFVIGRDGQITWSKVSRTHGGRTTESEVLAQIP
jgi:peroxiredoxin